MLSTSVILSFAATALAQFVPEPKDLTEAIGHAGVTVRYKQVPNGICELNPNVKSFSGYADIADHQHIFFWFFEARDVDPAEAPLTVWINGGPGSSSMLGLFQELGPCGVDPAGNVFDNPFSWTKVSNMLFIDQPAQTGFSYSDPVPGYFDRNSGEFKQLPNNTCPHKHRDDHCGTWSAESVVNTANSTANAAVGMWKTLQGFMGAFPQYSNHGGFHFATESYGGHYGPVFNEYIETQNAANIPGAKKINLESVLIGNGWFDPLISYEAYYNFTVKPGNTYDLSPFNTTLQHELHNHLWGHGNCIDGLKECRATGDNQICASADNYCASNVEGMLDNVGRDEYDVRELSPNPFPYGFFENYLNLPHVLQAVGAFTNYSSGSDAVGEAFGLTGDDGREDNTIESIAALLKKNVSVALYAGDADYNCNWLGVQKIAELVGAPGWGNAGFENISTSDNRVNGQVKQSGKFSFSRVYESGHEVPFYQPLLALELFKRVISRHDVATGKRGVDAHYHTHGPAESTFREGNSTVQWKVVSTDRTYDTKTGKPGPRWKVGPKKGGKNRRMA